MLPRSGGHYNYIGAAFGRFWSFLFGWMETLLDGAASVAAIAMVFAILLNDLTGGAIVFLASDDAGTPADYARTARSVERVISGSA